MRITTRTFGPAIALALSIAPLCANAAEETDAVNTIRAAASQIATTKITQKSALQSPARTIAMQWAKAEPVYSRNSNALVETRMLNRAIASLESDWASDSTKAPSDAKDVAEAAQNLLAATQ